MAIAIAYRAIQNGFDAFFTTAAALIDDLSAAFRAGELANALPAYTHPAVLVVDEVGLPRRQRAASTPPPDDLYDQQIAESLGTGAP